MTDIYVKRKKQKPLELPKQKYDHDFQDVRLLTRTPIIARLNNKKNWIYNSDMFTIKSIDRIKSSSTITDDSDKIVEIRTEMFQILFCIAFCITVHRSQGSTFNHSYTVHDFDKFGNKLKCVALSRASCMDNINIIWIRQRKIIELLCRLNYFPSLNKLINIVQQRVLK